MARLRILACSLFIIILFSGCQFFNNAMEYKDTTKAFMEALIRERYDSCVNMMAMEHPLMVNANAEQIKHNLPVWRKIIVENWGDQLDYTFIVAEKKFSTDKSSELPPHTTMLQMQFSNGKEFGVIKALFDDNSKKILSINTLDFKAPVPSMVLFWVLLPLVLCVPVFIFYVIVQIGRSNLKQKWLKYLAVLFLNLPTIAYTPVAGFAVKPFMFKILLGFSFSYQGYLDTGLEIGLPLGALYWYWRLKRRKNDAVPIEGMSPTAEQKKYHVLLDGEEIGTTMLEHADAPMGVVFGVLHLHSITTPYSFFQNYCREHGVQVSMDDAEAQLISTYDIPGMQVVAPDGTVVKGMSTYVSGMDEAFEINILGIAYPFYEEQFPQHVAAYKNQFDV